MQKESLLGLTPSGDSLVSVLTRWLSYCLWWPRLWNR